MFCFTRWVAGLTGTKTFSAKQIPLLKENIRPRLWECKVKNVLFPQMARFAQGMQNFIFAPLLYLLISFFFFLKYIIHHSWTTSFLFKFRGSQTYKCLMKKSVCDENIDSLKCMLQTYEKFPGKSGVKNYLNSLETDFA